MKCVKKIVRHYWKNVIKPFEQPLLSSDGELGGYTFAVSATTYSGSWYAWQAFDGLNGANEHVWYGNNNTPTYIFYNPAPLKVSKLTILNRDYASAVRAIHSGVVYGSNDNVTYTQIKSFTNTNYTANTTWDIDLSDNTNSYKYYKMTLVGDGSGAVIGELYITATYIEVIEGTTEDYDFYTDDEVTVLPTGIERHYWKYSFTSWTQPILTSNTSSRFLTFTDPVLSNCSIEDPSNPVWGNESVTDFSAFYNAFNSMSYFKVNAYLYKTYGAIVDIEFRNPLKISQIYIDGHTIESTASGLRGSLIYDMSNGTPVLLSQSTVKSYNTHTIDNVVCKKIRIAFQQQVDALSHSTRIQHIDITAQERVSVPATSSDYDYYTDDPVYYGINQ